MSSHLRVDIPISHGGDDRLDRATLVDRLAHVLLEGTGTSRRASRVVAGLAGPWGSGKSSVLKQLAAKLSSMANVIVIEFNPWVFSGSGELIAAFFSELKNQMGASASGKTREVLSALDRYRDALEPLFETAVPGSKFATKLLPKPSPRSAVVERKELEVQLEKLEAGVVVLIDELDRVEDADVRALAKLIKAIGDLPNVSYLVSYDRRRVEKALGDDGSAYVQKIIQFSVHVRPMLDYEAAALLSEQLSDRGFALDLNDSELMAEALPLLINILRTPRDVKRLVSGFAAIEPMVKNEVHPIDVLVYSALSAQAPDIRDAIANRIDHVVNDPVTQDAIFARTISKDEPSTSKALGIEEVSRDFDVLVKFLFPYFTDSRDGVRNGRVQERNNLMTLLYLGDPPFRVSRKKVEQFWSAPSKDVLRDVSSSGKMGDFLGQLSKLLPALPASEDRKAWDVLAQEARENSDRDSLGETVGRSLRDVLIFWANAGPDQAKRVHRVIKLLRRRRDLDILPSLLRHHMFAHGLVPEFGERGGPTIFDKNETRDLISSEIPRYEKVITSRQWVGTLKSTDIFYAIQQSGHWSAILRNALRDQLRSDRKMIWFARLFTPPHAGLEPGLINKFVSEPWLSARLLNLKEPKDEIDAQAVQKLRDYLRQSAMAQKAKPKA